jgi:hypothetical protein
MGPALFLPVFLVLLGLGDRAVSALGPPRSMVERLGLALAAGLGILMVSFFVLAAADLASTASAAALLGIFLALSRKNFRPLLLRLAGNVRPPERPRTPEGWAILGAAAFAALGGLMALAPPTGMDAGVLHFALPKVLLQEGGLPLREDMATPRSIGFTMVYAFGMALGGEILAKLLGYAAGLAAILLGAAIGERLRPGAGPWAALSLSATPFVSSHLGYEYLEIPALAFTLAGTLCLLRYARGEGPAWAVAACVGAGLAIQAKSSAFAAAVIAPAAMVLVARRGGPGRGATLAAGAASFAVTAGLWGLWWSFAFVPAQGGSAAAFVRDEVLSRPDALELARAALRTLGVLVTAGAYWSESCGPLIVACAAGAVAFRRYGTSNPLVPLLGLSVLAHVAVLAAASPNQILEPWFQGRYTAPAVIGFGAPAAGAFIRWARGRGGALGAALTVAAIALAAPLLAVKAARTAVAIPAALGLESRSSYLSRKIESFAACEFLNGLPRADVRVLYMGYRPYYLDRPYIRCVDGTMGPFFLGVRDSGDFFRKLRSERVTHVLFERPRLAQADWLGDPRRFFTSPPFREVGRWESPGGHWVIVSEFEP